MKIKRIVNLIVKLKIFNFIFIIIKFISDCLPASKQKIIVFGAMNGNFYGDNARHLFEYSHKSKKNHLSIWLTKDYVVYKRLKADGYNVHLMYSLRGIYYSQKAEWGFYTDSLRDLFLYPKLANKQIKLIALRHGRSVKRVRFARKLHKISAKETIERVLETKLIKYAISTSNPVSTWQEECLNLGDLKKHIVTGYPRNDNLVSGIFKRINIPEKFKNSKKILYAPTWRHGRSITRFFPFESFDIKSFNDFLQKHDITIWLRCHSTEIYTDKFQKLKSKFSFIDSRILFADHDFYPDVNSILNNFDGLISDFSALYHDFLLLDRQIILIPYDLDDFEKQNGFFYDYLNLAPGEVVRNIETFKSALSRVHNNDKKFEDKRKNLKGIIHKYDDNKSCERVLNLLK
jgi:CDP-glycerol glycerophosphotransferase (TagB/SpsB family)